MKMKKMTIAIVALVIVLGTAFSAEAGTKLDDFERVTYADTVMHDETGAVRKFGPSPFRLEGSDTMQIFEEMVNLPSSVVALYNKLGGRITVVDKSFNVGYGAGMNVQGAIEYDTYDIKVASGASDFSIIEGVRWLGTNMVHELAHFAERKTRPYWNESDFAAFEKLKNLYWGTGGAKQILELGYPVGELDDEIFARTYADFYGRGMELQAAAAEYPPEVLDFFNHISVIAAEMVERGY